MVNGVYGLGDLGNSLSKAAEVVANGGNVDLSPLNYDQLLGFKGMFAGLGADANANANEAVKEALIKKSNVSRETSDMTDMALFQQRLQLLPPEARQKVINGDWQVTEHRFYSSKVVTGVKHIDMFETGDTTSVGLSNIVQGKLPSEDYFLCTGLRIMAATLTAGTQAGLKAAEWGKLPALIRNGEWKFAIESTIYFDKTPLTNFNQDRTDVEMQYFKLSTPKMLYPQRTIDFEIDFAETLGSSSEIGLRVELCGLKTRKA